MLTACQKAVQSKVIEVCGSLSECEAFEDDDIIGTDSLTSYKDSAGNTVIDGLMNFGLLKINSDGSGIDKTNYTQIYNQDGQVVDNNQTKQRIASSINNIINKVEQKIGVIENDVTVKMCVEGRDDRWAGGDGTEKKFDRFPNLLDAYKLMIFNSGLDKAYANYHTKYTELVSKALEDQDDDIKSMLCAAISYNAGSAYCSKYEPGENNESVCVEYSVYPEMESIFSDKSVRRGNTGRGSVNNSDAGLSYVIKGADIATKLKNMSKGKGEFIQTDDKGNMIGKISMISVYSPSTNNCSVTTTSIMCSEIEKVITENKDSCFNTINVIGGSCNSGGIVQIGTNRTVTTEEYHGTVCTDFEDPVIMTSDIQM